MIPNTSRPMKMMVSWHSVHWLVDWFVPRCHHIAVGMMRCVPAESSPQIFVKASIDLGPRESQTILHICISVINGRKLVWVLVCVCVVSFCIQEIAAHERPFIAACVPQTHTHDVHESAWTAQQDWVERHGNDITHLGPRNPSPGHHHAVGSCGLRPPHSHVSESSPKPDCVRKRVVIIAVMIDLVRCELQTLLARAAARATCSS
jgi:hypothetical protein